MGKLNVIVYDSVEKKAELDAKYARVLTPVQRLEHYLDLVDFYRTFQSPDVIQKEEDDGIEWIILRLKKST